MTRTVCGGLTAMALALLAGCQPAGETPADPPQVQAAPEQSGDRQGTGGGRSEACTGHIVLTLDGETLWRRTRDELAADPAVGPVVGFRDGNVPGVRLGDLLAGLEGVRGVMVRSCGPRGLEVNAGQLVYAPLYLLLGNSGRWRLVDLTDPSVPRIFVRDVARIDVSTQEGPPGGDSPGGDSPGGDDPVR